MNFEKTLCCAHCLGNLDFSKPDPQCLKCNLVFNKFGKNSFNMFSDPIRAIKNAQLLMKEWLSEVDDEIETLGHQINNPGLLKLTAGRLKNLRNGLIHQKDHVASQLSFLNLPQSSQPNPLDEARGQMRPKNEKLNAYENNIARDWGWGGAENKAHLNQIQNLMPPALKSGSILFLGSGAGRLCYDFANSFPDFEVFSLERNPLLFGVSLSVENSNKQSWDWIEFPKLPTDSEKVAVSLRLSRPEKTSSPQNLCKLWADAFLPPVKPASFDIVVSSWFTDIVPQGLDAVAALVGYCLKPKGFWIQNGALAWVNPRAQNHLTPEEFLEYIEAHPLGFEKTKSQFEFTPYLQSPHSQMKRTEQVFGFCAQMKNSIESALLRNQFTKSRKPLWINNPDLPVPRLPELEKLQVETTILYFALSHLDGSRSLNEIAQAFSAQFGLKNEDSLQTLSLFFEKNIRV